LICRPGAVQPRGGGDEPGLSKVAGPLLVLRQPARTYSQTSGERTDASPPSATVSRALPLRRWRPRRPTSTRARRHLRSAAATGLPPPGLLYQPSTRPPPPRRLSQPLTSPPRWSVDHTRPRRPLRPPPPRLHTTNRHKSSSGRHARGRTRRPKGRQPVREPPGLKCPVNRVKRMPGGMLFR